MTNSIQNIVGNSTELKLANFLRENGYWAYVVPKKVGGQPCDVIACRYNNVWLIDAKHLEKEKASFTFDRVEPNQRTAMTYAHEFAKISHTGFAIYWERTYKFYYLPFDTITELEKNKGKSIKIEDLIELGEALCVQ